VLLELENAPVPEVGAPAPEFTLRSANGHDVTLSSYRNHKPVLLAFFPLAFTSTCTAEMCAFNEDVDAFAATGVEILPISVDSTASLREYRAKYNLSVDLLSDFRRTTSAAYGVLLEDKFYSKRAYFLIDTDGIVRWAHVEEQTRDRRDNAEILRRIRELLD
jgi:peroxiredoxin